MYVRMEIQKHTAIQPSPPIALKIGELGKKQKF